MWVFFPQSLLNSLVRKSPSMASNDTFMSSEENLASLLEQLGTTNYKIRIIYAHLGGQDQIGR